MKNPQNLQYPLSKIVREEWNKKVSKTAMYTIPAEEQALPVLYELVDLLQRLVKSPIQETLCEELVEFFFTLVFRQVCQNIIRSRYFKNQTALKLSNIILQNCVYLFPKYLSIAEKYPQFSEILTIVLCTDQYYYRSNRLVEHKHYPYQYFPTQEQENQFLRDLKVGDLLDVLKTSTLYDKVSWSRGKVLAIQEDSIQISYLNDLQNRKATFRINSPQIAPYQTKCKNFQWRMNLKEGDQIDCEDSYGGWYNATVLKVEEREDGKKTATVTFKIYDQEGTKCDENGRYIGFCDYVDTLDVTSPKLQPFCSISKHKNYDSGKSSYDADDINDLQFEEINGKRIYALPRKKHLSGFMFQTINKFGELGGLEKPLEKLEKEKNFNILSHFTKGISGVCAYLHRGVVKDVVEKLKPIIQRHLFTQFEQVGKQFSKEKSEMLFSGLKVLQKRIYSSQYVHNYENIQKMRLVDNCLQSEALKCKLQGLNELKDIVRSLPHSSDRNRGIKKWVKDSKIFQKVYLVNSHVQLIKKSQDFFRYLINENILEVTDLQRLYKIAQKGDYQSRISLYKLFQQVSYVFKRPHVDFLIDTILESELNLVLNEDIDLLHELSRHSSYFPREKVNTFFEKIILGDNKNTQMNDYAIKKYSEIVSRGLDMKIYRRQIIHNFINKITTHDITQVTKVLKGIFQGIGIGEWGKKDLNQILAEQNIDETVIRVISQQRDKPDQDKVITEILAFLLFIYKLSYRVRIYISVMKKIWEQLKHHESRRNSYYRWANEVISCEQGIQHEYTEKQFISFYWELFTDEAIINMNKEQFNLAKNLFIEINKKHRLITVCNTMKDKEIEKQYSRKVSISRLKLSETLMKMIYNIRNQDIAREAMTFFLNFYNSMENTTQEINTFMDQLLTDLKLYFNQQCYQKVQKTLKLIQIVIDDSEKKYEVDINSLIAKRKCDSAHFIIVNQVTYIGQSIKKSDTCIPLNTTLLKFKKMLAKEFNVSWEELRIVSNKQIPEYCNSKTLKELKLNPADPLTISRKAYSVSDGELIIGRQLNPKAVRIFDMVFKKYSTQGLMSKDQFNVFTGVCLGTLSKSYWDKVTQFFSNYDDNKDGFITLNNFLKFYEESSIDRAATVWSNLRNLGVRGDFKFIDDPQDQINSDNLPRNILTRNIEFYEILFKLLKVHQVAQTAFSFLERLPVAAVVEEEILGITSDEDNIHIDIDKIFNLEDPYSLFYKLHIIEYLAEYSSGTEQKWLLKFIDAKGFEKLLQILESLQNWQREDYKDLDFDIGRQIMNCSLQLLYQYFLRCFGSERILEPLALLEQTIDMDDKIEYLVTGKFPKPDQKLVLQNKVSFYNDWKGESKTNIVKVMVNILKSFWLQPSSTNAATFMKNNLIKKVIMILCLLLIDQNPQPFIQHIPTLLSNQAPPKILQQFYSLLLCICFYSKDKQNCYISTLFHNITQPKITSEHFRVLAVLVSRFGVQQQTVTEMSKVLLNNIIVEQNELTIEGCAKLLSNFNLKPKQIDVESIWGKCLFGDNITCHKQVTRTALYELILKVCECDPQMIKIIIEKTKDTIVSKIGQIKVNFSTEVNIRSSTGYAGMKNLGNICYINSVMQQLYSNRPFRYLLLRVNDEKDQELVLDKKGKQVDDNLLHQVQRIFAYLQLTTRVDFVPNQFCIAYKPFGGPVDIMVQQDVQEFVSMFFDRLETGIKEHPLKRLVSNFYVGKSTNLFNCHQCKQTKKVQEAFFSVSLEVKNSKSLTDSFNRYILGELINDYKCDFCNKNVDVTKKTRISRAPKVLIIHLQKIVFNLDTFVNQKISNKHQFPMQFNLYPYTLQCEQQNTKDAQNKQDDSINHPQLQYELTGIICHIGNADAGHYISYIRTENKKWLEFNDSIINTFNPSNIEAECFGGQCSTYDDDFDWNRKENSKSAYLLIYQKVGQNNIEMEVKSVQQKVKLLQQLHLQEMQEVQPVKQQEHTESQEQSSDKPEDSEQQRETKQLIQEKQIEIIRRQKSEDNIITDHKKVEESKDQSIIVKIQDSITTFIPNKLQAEIQDDNKVHFFQRNLASPAFSKFFAKILAMDHQHNVQMMNLCQKLTFGFWLKSSAFKDLLNTLGVYIEKDTEAIQKLVIENPQIVSLLIENSDVDVRTNIAKFLSQVLSKYIQQKQLKLQPDSDINGQKQMLHFLDNLFSLLSTTVSKCWTKFSQYFQFWYQFSMKGPAQLNYMIRKEVIKHFIDYFLDKKSPLKIYASKAHQIGSTYANPNFSTLLKTVGSLIEQYFKPGNKTNFKLTKADYSVILHFDFLEKLISDNYENVAAKLAKQLCPNNLHASEKFAIVLLKGLSKATYESVQPCLDVLHEFIKVDDQYRLLRMKWVLGKQTLSVDPITRKLNVMKGYSIEERLYNFDSSIFVEQGATLLDPIFQLNRRVQNFSILSLQQVLKLCDECDFARKYIFNLGPPNYIYTKYVDFFDQFINRYIEDAKRVYGYSFTFFNKEQLGKSVKKLYQQVLKKVQIDNMKEAQETQRQNKQKMSSKQQQLSQDINQQQSSTTDQNKLSKQQNHNSQTNHTQNETQSKLQQQNPILVTQINMPNQFQKVSGGQHQSLEQAEKQTNYKEEKQAQVKEQAQNKVETQNKGKTQTETQTKKEEGQTEQKAKIQDKKQQTIEENQNKEKEYKEQTKHKQEKVIQNKEERQVEHKRKGIQEKDKGEQDKNHQIQNKGEQKASQIVSYEQEEKIVDYEDDDQKCIAKLQDGMIIICMDQKNKISQSQHQQQKMKSMDLQNFEPEEKGPGKDKKEGKKKKKMAHQQDYEEDLNDYDEESTSNYIMNDNNTSQCELSSGEEQQGETEYFKKQSSDEIKQKNYQETYHPVLFEYKPITEVQSGLNGVNIYYHQSIVTEVLTQPTLYTNKSFVSSFASQKVLERLKEEVWKSQRKFIIKGYLAWNSTRDYIRIKTSDGCSMVKPSEYHWVWADEIIQVWTSERNLDWPKRSIYPAQES